MGRLASVMWNVEWRDCGRVGDRVGGRVERLASVMWGVEWRDCGSVGKLTNDVGCFWIMICSIRRDFLNNDGNVDWGWVSMPYN